MSRSKYQRGSLRSAVPAHGSRPERRLPRGEYLGIWYRYVSVDGRELRRKSEKIIDRSLAQSHELAINYEGPLTKGDAQKVLDILIAEDGGQCVQPDRKATLAAVARQYLSLAEPNWGPHMVRSAGNLVKKHIIGGNLGERPIAELTEADLQSWLNTYVNAGWSRSLLKGLLLHLRAIFKCARERKLMTENPTEDLRARSKARVCERYLSISECQRLLGQLSGRNRVIFRLFVQVGLRPEELFALRRDDVQETGCRLTKLSFVARARR